MVNDEKPLMSAVEPWTPIFSGLLAERGRSAETGRHWVSKDLGEVQSAIFREATPDQWVTDDDQDDMADLGEISRHGDF
jgi:hypothetical protein